MQYAVRVRRLPCLTRLDTRALKMDLFVDGNIAQTFSPEGAVRFFTRLLGVDAQSLCPTISQKSPHAFFITSFAMQYACPSFAINGRLLDYVISQAGTVVPQRMWSSRISLGSQCNTNTSLNMPMYFVHNDHATLGLPLLKAVENSRAMLLCAGDTAPIGNISFMYIYINVGIFSFKDSHVLFGDCRLKMVFLVARLWLVFTDHDQGPDEMGNQ